MIDLRRRSLPAFTLTVLCVATTASAQPAQPAPSEQSAWGASLSQPAPAQAAAAQPAPVVVVQPPPRPVAAAQPAEPASLGTVPAARHALYLEGNSLFLTGSLGVSYSYRPVRGFAVSAGFGVSYATVILASLTLYGGQVMVHGLLGGDGPSSFEIAGGAALTASEGSWYFSTTSSSGGVSLTPSMFLGYRYQPLSGGVLFRVGAAWSYGIGIGASLSVGFAF